MLEDTVRSGDRVAFVMMSAVGVMVPACFITLDVMGVPMPDFSTADAKLGAPTGFLFSILVASIALGLAMIFIGAIRITGSHKLANPASAWRQEFQGWLSVSTGANLPAFAAIGLTCVAILF